MGKATFSFSLEDDIIQKIDKVKNDLKLSSRSIALERIVLAYNNENSTEVPDRETLKELIREVILESKTADVPKKEPSSFIKTAVTDAFSEMKE